MHVESLDSRQSPNADALSALEAKLDGRLRREITTLLGSWRAGRLHFARAARSEVDLRKCLAVEPRTADELTFALTEALRQGACESAIALSERLVPRLTELQASRLPTSLEAVIETMLMAGKKDVALRLAHEHVTTLRSGPTGVGLLELLGLGDGAIFLPDGCPNFLGLSRSLDAGALDALELTRLLGSSKRLWLRFPELHLLFFMALRCKEPRRAVAWLNRFFAAHHLPAWDLNGDPESSAGWLGALRPTRLPRRDGGPLVSVIVPVRNAAATLVYAVQSLLEQTHGALEILLCDDASEDESLEIMRELAAADQRVRLFRSEVNQGSYNLRNMLAARARGSILTFHDADDLALPTRISTQLGCLRKSGGLACVSSLLRVSPDGSFRFFKNQRATRLCPVSLMLTPEVFQRVGPFRPVRVGGDLELYTDLVARCGPRAVARVRSPLTLVAYSPRSVTRSVGTEALEDGYRSPLRRAYCEMVYAKHSRGLCPSDGEIDERLTQLGNRLHPSEIHELA